MEEDCKRCQVPEVLSGEISLSLREWSLLEKARFWVLIYGKVVGWLSKKLFFFSALAILLMMIPIVIDVSMRFLSTFNWFNMSVHGVIEIEELLFLVLVFCGFAWAKYNGGHISVDLIYDHFPKWLKIDLAFFHTTLIGTFTLLMTYFIFESAVEKVTSGDMTPDLYIPYWPFYFIAFIGSLMLCLCIFKQTLDAFLEVLENKQYMGMIIFTTLAILTVYMPFVLMDMPLGKDMAFVASMSVAVLMGFLVLRMPIGFAMAVTAILGLIVTSGSLEIALSYLGTTPTTTALNYIMTTVPMFVLMGEVAMFAGISSDMFNAASIWFGRLPGSLTIAGVIGCAGFAAICGESLPTALTMTSVALPEMKKHNYNPALGCAALASGGTLGILIPPSMGFIMYAIVTEESIGALFVAGIIPGFMLAILFCILILVMAIIKPELAPRGQAHSMKAKLMSITGIIPILLLIMLVLGGILTGSFSPTEGGAVGAFGTIIYALCRRRLSLPNFIHALQATAILTARMILIFIGVNILGFLLANTQMPNMLADWVLNVASNRYIVFAAIVMLYIVLGCLMNVVPMILLTLPALFPTVVALGFDPVWFGVVTVILMEMGQITPPMGIIVFAVAALPNTPSMGQIFKFIFPFVLVELFAIILCTIFPDIALFLPKALLGYNPIGTM